MHDNPTPSSLLQLAAQISRLERGKLSVIREGPDGPYYNHQYRRDGKKISRYVPRGEVPFLQDAIDGFQRFDGFIQQYVDQMVEKTRREIATDGKKNLRPRRRSASPKNKKSSS